MDEYKCPKCNSTNLFTRKKDTQTGLYCKECGRWIKWLNKDEARVFETDTNDGSKWISVKDRLPTHEDGKVLICTAYGISIAQKTTTNHWKGDNAIPKLITHWMPLPEAPKED